MTTEIYGTNADGTLNEDYCMYCYKDGAFVGPADCTMEQMIDHCAQFTDEMNKHTGLNFTPEQAKEQMRGSVSLSVSEASSLKPVDLR